MFQKLLGIIAAIGLCAVAVHMILTQTTPHHVREANAPLLAHVRTLEGELSDIVRHDPLTANDARTVHAIEQRDAALRKVAHDDLIGIRVVPPMIDDITERIDTLASASTDTLPYDRARHVAETETLLKEYRDDVRLSVEREVDKWRLFNITLGLMALTLASGIIVLTWRDDT